MTVPAVDSTAAWVAGNFDSPPSLSSISPSAGSNRIALLSLMWEIGGGPTSATATWNGSSFTSLGFAYNPDSSSMNNGIWFAYLLDTNFPGSAGNVTVTTNATGLNDLKVCMTQITGAAQQAPDTMQTAQGSTPLTGSITTPVADELIIQGATTGRNNAVSGDSSQTTLTADNSSSTGMLLCSLDAATAQTYNLDVSSVSAKRFVTALTAIQPAGGGGGVTIPVFMHHYQQQGQA